MTPVVKRVLIGVGVLAAIVATAATIEGARILLHAYASAAHEPEALAAWRNAFGDPEALLASYRHAGDNPSAERLVALAKALGIDLRQSQSLNSADATALGEYVHGAGIGRDAVGDPPDHVRAYLAAHQPAIEAIAVALAEGDVPVWRSNPEAPVPVPDVSVFGLRALNDVLLADALVLESQGRSADADRLLRGAWQLLRSTRDQPELIGTLTTLGATRADLAVVRRVGVDPAAWRPRVGEFDYGTGMKRALEADAASHVHMVMSAMGTRVHATFQRAFVADFLDGTRATLVALPALSPTSDAPSAGVPPRSALWLEVAPGTIVAQIARPGLDRAWMSAEYLMLEVELTERVLDARDVKARTGAWPKTTPDVPSSRMPGARWVYTTQTNGAVTMALNQAIPASFGGPLTFEARR